MSFDKEIWILFEHSKHWSQLFLKKNFGHCKVLTRDKFEWFIFDPKVSFIQIKILADGKNSDVPRLLKKEGYRVIRLKISAQDKLYYEVPRLMTCVALVQYFLGIKVFALTPYQLFKRLCNANNISNIVSAREII